ncbi:EAL domain-containing protein [Ureibacillus endophyticus]|uniref:EAL domain-containing protein n=1 Tax=Ureibacillus endophyticus TaxID=1978490 RepID=A0A494Z344_9BACL|nr:EAL domain-containing protein [Lysinibacillus endophyticus]RKQ16940.1 EAL domain-containing protein [Lysinibacillus endophyticus]
MRDLSITKKSNKLKELFLRKDSQQPMNTNLNEENNSRLFNYYSSLALYHPDIVIVFSKDSEVITIDYKKIHELLGLPIQDVKEVTKMLSQDHCKKLKSAFYNTLKGNTEKHEIEIKTHSNQSIFLVVTFIPIKHEGQVEGVYLIAANVTEKVQLKNKLTLSEKHLNSAQEITEIGSWEYLIEEDRLYCSDYFYHIFGINKDDCVKMEDPFKLVHPHDYEDAYEKIHNAIEKGQNFVNHFRIYHGKNQDIRYIKVHAEVFFKEDRPYKIIGIIKDETYQIELENQITKVKDNFYYMFDNISSGIWMKKSFDGKFEYVSKALEKITAYPAKRIYEEKNLWYNMIQPDCYKTIEEGVKELSKGRSIEVVYRIINGAGETKWILEQIVPRKDVRGNITNYFGLVTDISGEMETKEQLTYYSSYDALTDLPNQKSLYNHLDKLCKEESAFAVLYFDIDRFNIINDSLGYHVGDEALKLIGKRLSAMVSQDVYLSRLSSNDFIMVVQHYSSKQDIHKLADNIIREFENPLIVQDYELYVTTSIGITFFPEEGKEKLVLLENAHTALYKAKKEGKNNYQLSSHLTDISSYKKYVLDRDMRKAILNEEFELYFQPQVDPSVGKICGAEALIRWNHKEWGLVSPGEFIPLAEENHMINNITDWVIQKVIMYLRDWMDREFEVRPISINIPPIRFIKKGLLEFVKEQLDAYQVPAHYLEFEITEGSLLKSDKKVIRTIEGLKELGINFAIDDFGTGYASLDSLRKFKPNTIKIDKIFIDHIGNEDGVERGIISSAMHLSKVLGMKVVAEGVEKSEQFTFLKQNGCDLVQGYIYSKPVMVKTFEKLLKQGYLKAEVNNSKVVLVEKRKYYRFQFPAPIEGEMTIVEVNGKGVNVGKSPILIDNIGIGGVKILSTLKLPVNTQMKFSVKCQILNEIFELTGAIKWFEEVDSCIFTYGLSFEIDQATERRLSSVINRLSSYRRNNKNIPDTAFVYEAASQYFNKKLLQLNI